MHANQSANKKFDRIAFNVGLILKMLFEAGNNMSGEISIDLMVKKLPGDDNQKFLLYGALSVLRILGLISIDDNGAVRVTSRLAHFAIGSLSRFCNCSIPIFIDASNDSNVEKQLVDFTKSLESVRDMKIDGTNDPIHSRSILNVIIKSRQIRRGRKRDVYLHIYHPKWNAYHLVGISMKGNEESEDQLVTKAMEKEQLLLLPNDYKIKVSKYEPKKITEISHSTGAITEYTYIIKIATKISGKLSFRKWINKKAEWGNQRYRWFTIEEIEQFKSKDEEKIFFSTPHLIREIPPEDIPVCVDKIEDDSMSPIDIILRKLTYSQLAIILLPLFLLIIYLISPQSVVDVLAKLHVPSTILQNIAAIISILSGLPMVTMVYRLLKH